MCEWLSREEWCDVSLLCDGRAFGAHRAVLASVSCFLRRILLSCPIEDTPTLIVLPDFDLEALSAVLYYIYNGEVTMPRQKVDKFLDIVKAMQIFVDRQYLTELSINIDIDYTVNKRTPNDASVFVLRSEKDDSNSSLVTFKKRYQHTASCNTKDVTDYKDCKQASRNWNEQFKPALGNLQSSHKDRQRDYFLRDSFMETYPRNRNANGRAAGAGVPAIPNTCYHSPTSLFLTNANVNGSFSHDTVNLPSDGASSQMPYNLRLTSKPHQDNVAKTELHRKLSDLSKLWMGPGSSSSSMETLRNNSKHKPYLDLSIQQKAHTAMPTSVAKNNLTKTDYCIEIKVEKNLSYNSQHKVAILNKALGSPWCPRLPNSYRPFRRKGPSLNGHFPNDSNNNVHVIPTLLKDERLQIPSDICNSGNFIPKTILSPEDSNYPDNNQQPPTGGRYTCNECGKTFSQLRNFKYHMSVHRGTREFAASCAVCGKSFNDRGYLSSHMKIHRNRKEYKCSQCPKSFNQRVAYNMHVRIHTGVKPHVCPTCGKAFSRKMLLKQHQRTHSGERPYACPHCEKRFADRSNMSLHLRLHTGVKPFKCPMCPKSFTKKHHLKSHVNFHTGAKPYSCPRCSIAFTQSSNMRTHLKRCTAPEPTTGTSENST
ncbi:zinc finger and SCAN domain-containing protein 12-like [Cydia strobilella]|uniref:zinc finger and SCAN domain-containing protein 12-like n=1 Tax=Cydia strobilella TaxID=1100964 RepID=UPI003004EBC6